MSIVEIKGDTIKGVWTWVKGPAEKDHVIPFAGKWEKENLTVSATNGTKVSMNGIVKGDKLIVRYKGPAISPTLEFSLTK